MTSFPSTGNNRPLPLTPRTLIVIIVLAAALWYLRGQQRPEGPPANAPAPNAPAPSSPASKFPDLAPAPRPAPAEKPAPSDRTGGKTLPDDESRAAGKKPRSSGDASGPRTTFHNVTIRNEDGEVVFRGDIDLASTLGRIDSGERLRFSHDGSTFQNREGRLPRKSSGYYREWVHPTPKLSGPGPQRIITGTGGEAYYTPDHYRTFERIR